MASFACSAARAIMYLCALAEDGRAHFMLGQSFLLCQHVHKPSEQLLARLLQQPCQLIVAEVCRAGYLDTYSVQMGLLIS